MSLTRRITAHPLPFDPDRASDTLAALPAPEPAARDLLRGMAGCSPFLAALMVREAAWLERALTAEPEDSFAALLATLEPGPVRTVGPALREAKRRVALLTALADCGGVWTLVEVTAALTDFSDRALEVALRSVLAPALAAGKIPGQGPGDIDSCAGLSVIAMGKGGARELNYSSDIDLICLFDDERFDGAVLAEARMGFVRAVRKAMALLSDITADGYVFRTDLRLRPDPSVTPVAVSIAAAERYYESLGRTWERAAYIKARAAAGDIAAGERFLKHLTPFVWRRYLDFAAIEEARAMQGKIRAHKDTWDDTRLDGRDLKLAPGGIREIEFFVQTRQLIAGGRDRSLRVRGTCDGLRRLTEAGWIGEAEANRLVAAYGRLRCWEHRVQMVQDAQTHSLPRDDRGWDRLARFLGYDQTDRLRAQVRATVAEVQSLTAPLMGGQRTSRAPDDAPAATDVSDLATRWHRFPALRSQRSRRMLDRLLPGLLARFARAARPDEALAHFEAFLSRLPAGVQLFAMFEANPHLVELIVDIAATSPALAEYLGRHPQVLEAVIDGDFFSDWPGADGLAGALAARLDEEQDDYERRLDAARREHREWRFRIGVHHLRGLIDAAEAARQYADLAEATLRALWPHVVEAFAASYGPPPGRGAAVLAMGSLGAAALTATSDLDLIVIYDDAGETESTGRRSVPSRTYYARLTKALVTALGARMAEGTLYEVDMRLRPSGRQGPVATAWTAFQSYQRHEAWVWEHMALTRARPVAGDMSLCGDIEAFRQGVLAEPVPSARVAEAVIDMRRRLAEAKPARGPWDTENGPGGLQDIELLATAGALLSGCASRAPALQLAAGPWPEDIAQTLTAAHRRFVALKQAARLLHGGALDPDALGEGGRVMLLREAGAGDLTALRHLVAKELDAARAAIERGLTLLQD